MKSSLFVILVVAALCVAAVSCWGGSSKKGGGGKRRFSQKCPDCRCCFDAYVNEGSCEASFSTDSGAACGHHGLQRQTRTVKSPADPNCPSRCLPARLFKYATCSLTSPQPCNDQVVSSGALSLSASPIPELSYFVVPTVLLPSSGIFCLKFSYTLDANHHLHVVMFSSNPPTDPEMISVVTHDRSQRGGPRDYSGRGNRAKIGLFRVATPSAKNVARPFRNNKGTFHIGFIFEKLSGSSASTLSAVNSYDIRETDGNCFISS